MMKYEIFKDVVENAVLDYLPPEYQNSELHLVFIFFYFFGHFIS